MGKQRDRGRAWKSRRRTVSIADDDRGRVPFALVGVLLLVSASTYAAGLTDQGLVSENRSVERAVDRVDADATAALRHAAREAAYTAAARPVVRPVRTSVRQSGAGTAAVRPGTAFEDAFRIRAALAGHRALTAVNASVGGVTATARFDRLESPLTPDDVVTLREQVDVGSTADGTATRVVFENVTIRATRDGRTVAEQTRDRAVVVAVPTLAAHERTERFERRLNAGPVEGPGLGRQLTASLYPITWARGYGQYGKVPIQNVLSNRHVELSTNAGIVRVQRDVFGTSDPDARGGVAAATARTGITDLLAPTPLDEAAWSDAVIGAPTPSPASDHDGFAAARSHTDETRRVAVGHAADAAAVEIYDAIETIARRSHRVEATLVVDADRVSDGGRPRPPHPAPTQDGWSRVDVDVEETVSVRPARTVPDAVPAGLVRPGERVNFGEVTRTVVVERTVVSRWRRVVEQTYSVPVPGGPPVTATREVTVGLRTTRASATDRYRVEVAVRGAHAPRDDAPRRPAVTFGAGTGYGGADLGDTPAAARASLGVATAASVDRLAERAVESGDIRRSTVVYGRSTRRAHDHIAADLEEVRADVEAIDTDLSMESMARGAATPYAELAARVRDDRRRLVDAPSTYDGAADRARVAVRAAYVDAVLAELSAASERRETTTSALFERVEEAFGGPSVGEVLASREAARDVDPYTVGANGPGGAVTFVPDAAPGYLPRTTVDGSSVDAIDGSVRPLATRNVNYVTVPYSDVSAGIVDRLLGDGGRVDVGAAGRALLAADHALAARPDPDLRADRSVLARSVEASLRTVDRALVDAIAERTTLSRAQRRAAVSTVKARYDDVGSRAIAVSDGAYADAVADETARIGGLTAGERRALAARLRVASATATGRDDVRIPTSLVDEPAQLAREQMRAELAGAIETGAEAAVTNATERWAPNSTPRVGAGLPVAPVPAYWVATVNAWRVQVRGSYPRFTLTADVGPPNRRFEYVREAAAVTVTVGGDTIQLGTNEPVAFETGTVIVVAVPPGPPGVGDIDGTRDERSPGW